MIRKLKQFVLQRPWLRDWINPIYLLCKYPFLIVKYKAIDPVEYFVYKGKDLIYLVNSKVAQTAITNTAGNTLKKEYSKIDTKFGERKYTLSPTEKTYYSFTFVRNPFERLYSCYYSKYIADKKYDKERLDFDYYMGGIIKKDKGFPHFVKTISKIPDALADRHFKSQYSLIYKESILPIDFIGRYENINEEFKIIQKRFNLDPLPHLNPSGKKNWRSAYTPELVNIVKKRYEKDLSTWYPTAADDLTLYIQEKGNT